MGRYIEQGVYENRNFWTEKNARSPRASEGRKDIDGGKFFTPATVFQANKNFSVNHRLTSGDFTRLLPFMERVALKNSEYIYHPGEKIEYIYFPETAVIAEFQFLEDGRMIEISMTGKEGIAGFLPVFSSRPSANWTQVSMPGNALRIGCKTFEREVSKNPALSMALFDYISTYVAQISQRAVCNSYHSIEQRFGSWLLMLQNRRESDTLPLTQEQIARSLGAHRPSVTHIAQSLREREIIDYVRGKIFIQNRRALEEAACGCYLEIDKNLTGAFDKLPKLDSAVCYA